MVAFTSQRFRSLLLCALVASVAIHGWDLAVPGPLDRTGRMKCPDFLQFYTYGTLARTGRGALLYDEAAHEHVARYETGQPIVLSRFEPNYSPLVAWAMAPLTALPYLSAMALWGGMTVACYAIAIALLRRATPASDALRDLVWLAAFAFPGLFAVIRYGQLSAVSLLIVSSATLLSMPGLKPRPTADPALVSGAILGLLVYKPNLLLAPAAIFLLSGQWRLLAGLALGAIAETAVALASVGPHVFGEYVGVLLHVARHPELVQIFPAESHSFGGAVRLLVPWPPAVLAATLVGLVLAVVAGAYVWRRDADVRARWAVLVLAMLFASPHLLTYDLLLLAVPLVLIVDVKGASLWTPRGVDWRLTLLLLYGGAWPGTLLARLYGMQLSTIGMGLALALLFHEAQHQLVGREAEHREVDRPTA